jgi:hypothetical protein
METLTAVHVVISLIAILSGLVVLFGMLTGSRFDGLTALFLITTVLTSVTGFLFPFHGFIPAVVIGIISMVILAIAIVARYIGHLEGAWRWIYVLTALPALYLNVFVLVAQLFMKLPSLKALAPTQSEPPFLLAQLVVLALFVILIILAAIKFRPVQLRNA